MRIVAMLRVKNEGRWLSEVLAAIHPLTTEILVFDDHSTDDTRQVAARAGAVVVKSPYALHDTNESRDKNAMLGIISTHEPDWVLSIDGDEVLERGAADRIRAKLLPGVGVLGFPFRYVWDDRQRYRVDGVYGTYARASMFRWNRGCTFGGSAFACNFHCGNIPANVIGTGASVQSPILHLGYMHATDRAAKYCWYNAKDPGNQYEDQYRHVAAGLTVPHADLVAEQRRIWLAIPDGKDKRPWVPLPPPPPEDEKCKHGGPLKLYALPSSCWPVVQG